MNRKLMNELKKTLTNNFLYLELDKKPVKNAGFVLLSYLYFETLKQHYVEPSKATFDVLD